MMVKSKTMSRPALDWAVAVAEGCEFLYWGGEEPFRPTTRWADAGPIIEREGISIWETCDRIDHPRWSAVIDIKTWGDDNHPARDESFGDTPLIAAMRCYVAHKLGDTINIPECLS